MIRADTVMARSQASCKSPCLVSPSLTSLTSSHLSPCVAFPWTISQLTGDIDTMLIYCCTSLVDVEPTLNHHWTIIWWISCFLGCLTSHPSQHDTLTNAGLILGHRLRHWPNIEPTLGESDTRPLKSIESHGRFSVGQIIQLRCLHVFFQNIHIFRHLKL